MDSESGKGVAEQVRLDYDRSAFTRLKDHTMQEKAQAGIQGGIGEVRMIVLKDIRDSSPLEPMAAVALHRKSNAGERLSGLQVVMLTEQVSRSLKQPHRFLAMP